MPRRPPASTVEAVDRPTPRSLPRRLRLALLYLAMVVGGYLGLWWAYTQGKMLGSPVVLVPLSALGVFLLTDRAQRWIGGGRLDNRVGLRLGLFFPVLVAVYLNTGWGCVLLALAPWVIYRHIARSGDRATRASIVAVVASTVVAQGLLALGYVQSVVAPANSHANAGALLTGTILATIRFGRAERQRRAAEEQRQVAVQALAHTAMHDPLTELANRRLFMDRLNESLRQADPEHHTTVVMIDLDNFRDVNDRLGHQAGDQLLTTIADRLRHVCPDALAARLGGDEFALVLHPVRPDGAIGVHSVRPGGANVTSLLDRLLDTLAAPVELAGQRVNVRASIGVATTDTVAAHELLRRADVAMYAAKHAGGARWCTFTPSMDAVANEHARIEQAIEQGLAHDRFRLLYQPVVRLVDGRMVGAEALLRLCGADGTIIGPDQFIPVAESTGQIQAVGRWVLRSACGQASDWRRRLGPAAPARINVNVSARQLEDPHLLTHIAAALDDHNLPPDALVIEVTETAAMNGDNAADVLRDIKRLGMSIALDDFGTGYSSLSLLKTCPVDIIKIDKSFVADVGRDPDSTALAQSLTGVAAGLRLQTVAEGVETGTQARLLHEMGYQHAQGYFFARPLPPRQVEDLIANAPIRPIASPARTSGHHRSARSPAAPNPAAAAPGLDPPLV